MATKKFLGTTTLKFLGASTLKFFDDEAASTQTETPDIISLVCEASGSNFVLRATIKNEDGSAVSMEIARNSAFTSGLQTVSFTGLQTRSDITVATQSGEFSGSQSVFARATASGKTVSNVASLNTEIFVCGL